MTTPPVESIPAWWNPGRAGVATGPSWFAQKLDALPDPVVVTWNAFRSRWQVFAPTKRINHPLSHGWRLLFIVEDEGGEYQPLDERVLARLYISSRAKWGDGLKYFDAVQRERARDKEKVDAADWDDTSQRGLETFNHSQISVSMCGQSNGSKFADYHS